MINNIEKRLDKVFCEVLGIECVEKNLSQKNCATWDSVNHLNLILALESEFGVLFEPEEIAAMRDRDAVLAALTKKVSL